MGKLSYQNGLKKWQVGVLALEELAFKVKERVKLGIDLEKKHDEVRKLFLKHCSRMCVENRCDTEDVLQEVYKGILIRNSGSCPFNPKKSAFSTYIVMVAKCVTINYINKTNKKSERETYGKTDSIECEPYAMNTKEEGTQEESLFLTEMRSLLKGDALAIFDDLMAGHKVSQISLKRKIDSRKVNKTIEEIRRTLEPYAP